MYITLLAIVTRDEQNGFPEFVGEPNPDGLKDHPWTIKANASHLFESTFHIDVALLQKHLASYRPKELMALYVAPANIAMHEALQAVAEKLFAPPTVPAPVPTSDTERG